MTDLCTSEKAALEFYKHIITQCMKTNILLSEYEMYLRQEIYRNEKVFKNVGEWLLLQTPDKNGWIYWQLYRWYLEDKNYGENYKKYLSLSVQCNHPIALAINLSCNEYLTNENVIQSLQELISLGNKYAYCDLSNVYFEINEDIKADEILLQGVENGDINCMLQYVNVRDDKTVVPVYIKLFKLGYHGEVKIKFGANGVWKDINKYIRENKDEFDMALRHLSELKIPCVYIFQKRLERINDESKDKYEHCLNEIIQLHESWNNGCNECEKIISKDIKSQIIYKQYCELKELRKLHSQDIESIVKNIIGEYIN
jgi:hypothetical protein